MVPATGRIWAPGWRVRQTSATRASRASCGEARARVSWSVSAGARDSSSCGGPERGAGAGAGKARSARRQATVRRCGAVVAVGLPGAEVWAEAGQRVRPSRVSRSSWWAPGAVAPSTGSSPAVVGSRCGGNGRAAGPRPGPSAWVAAAVAGPCSSRWRRGAVSRVKRSASRSGSTPSAAPGPACPACPGCPACPACPVATGCLTAPIRSHPSFSYGRSAWANQAACSGPSQP